MASHTLGVIKPTTTSKSFEHLQSILPDDIALKPLYMGFQHYSKEEFASAIPSYEEKIAALVADGCDAVHPEGAPPFMVQGLARERELIAKWEAEFGVPIFTTGSTQRAAMAALGIKTIVGLSPFEGELADAFTRYFQDAGIEVLSMGRPAPEEVDIRALSSGELLALVADKVKRDPAGADALYILGSNWPLFPAIGELEDTIGMPVLHPVTVRYWYICRHYGLQAPLSGFGRLVAEMPELGAGS
jgi:maleate cis-trans isomerase